MKMAQLMMKRPVGASDLPPASPIAVREASRSDGPQLAAVLGAAFPEMEWDVARVNKDLFDATDVPVTYVIEDNGLIVATASVRYHARFPESGYVHWVGVDPKSRGRRLGSVVMARVMRRFAADGRQSCILETDDIRLPAIASYLGQGYVPQYPDVDHEPRWSRVFEQLAQSRRESKDR
jgi:ribosomal protein S18 acetylase RimI-like enzyme